MSLRRRGVRKALATVPVVLLLILLVGGGVALIWLPLRAIFDFTPRNLAWGTPFGHPVTSGEQRTDLIMDSMFFIVIGVLLLVFAVMVVVSFVSYLKEC